MNHLLKINIYKKQYNKLKKKNNKNYNNYKIIYSKQKNVIYLKNKKDLFHFKKKKKINHKNNNNFNYIKNHNKIYLFKQIIFQIFKIQQNKNKYKI